MTRKLRSDAPKLPAGQSAEPGAASMGRAWVHTCLIVAAIGSDSNFSIYLVGDRCDLNTSLAWACYSDSTCVGL